MTAKLYSIAKRSATGLIVTFFSDVYESYQVNFKSMLPYEKQDETYY